MLLLTDRENRSKCQHKPVIFRDHNLNQLRRTRIVADIQNIEGSQLEVQRLNELDSQNEVTVCRCNGKADLRVADRSLVKCGVIASRDIVVGQLGFRLEEG
jgi:hypothetical protein